MNAKAYMHQIREKKRYIEQLNRQYERDLVLACGNVAIRYDKDVVQTSPDGDRMLDMVISLEEISRERAKALREFHKIETECIRYLIKLDYINEKVLTYHYLDGIEWHDVGILMNFTNEKYIYEVKDKALKELDELLKTTD